MSGRENIDAILADWPYKPGMVVARRVEGEDGRDLLQMRIEMGVLQLEVEGRPDGQRPGGAETYYDHLVETVFHEGEDLRLTEEQCLDVDREFVQFYHRRICWLALHEFANAQRDADHTLALMDLSAKHSDDRDWILSHEQYRPFVMFHRVQAAALSKLDDDPAEAALAEIDRGLKWFEQLYDEHEAEDRFEDDELVARLLELKETIREHYDLGPTLAERLADAIAAEEYERAAQLRDEIAQRQQKQGGI